VQFARPAVIPFLVSRAGVQPRGLPIFLDNPTLDDEGKRQAYAVLLQIPWLHKEIRTAIRHRGLGRLVAQDDRAAAKLRDKILHDDVERHKADLREAGERQFEAEAYREVARKHGLVFESKHWPDDPAAALDSAADALQKRLYRWRKRNK
jgi:hypothetical protein